MSRTVYIVDDDDAVRASLETLLSLQGDLVIHSFRSGDAFLDEMQRLDPGVVLLDYQMPGTNGLDVLNVIGGNGTGKFVSIMLTAQGNLSLAVQAMKAGALDFLEKPCDPVKLLQIVEAAIERFQRETVAVQRAEDARAKIARLSAREADVLLGLTAGRPNKLIAHQLGLSPRTVEIYRAKMMEKLDVRSLSEALRIAFAAGLLSEDQAASAPVA